MSTFFYAIGILIILGIGIGLLAKKQKRKEGNPNLWVYQGAIFEIDESQPGKVQIFSQVYPPLISDKDDLEQKEITYH